MINNFDNPHPLTFVFLFLMTCILSSGLYFYMYFPPSGMGVLELWWVDIRYDLIDNFAWLLIFSKVLILFFQALYFNSICGSVGLFSRHTLMPGFVFIITGLLLSLFLSFDLVVVGHLFFLMACSQLIRVKHAAERFAQNMFYASLYISLASLFYPGYILFLFWVWFLMPSIGALSARHVLLTFAGAILPFYFLGLYFFANNQFVIFVTALSNMFTVFSFQIPDNPLFNPAILISTIFFGFGYLNYVTSGHKLLKETRSGYYIFQAALIPAVLQLLFVDASFVVKYFVFLPVFSVFITFLFAGKGNNIWMIIAFYLFLLITFLLPWIFYMRESILVLMDHYF